MVLFAAMVLDPATIAAWLCGGLGAGWLIGQLMEEPSYGSIVDLILGGVGGLIGGLSFSFFKQDAGFWGSILVALAVAFGLILSARTAVARRSE